MDAIIYTSSSGYTKEYALMLAKNTGLPCCDIADRAAEKFKGKSIVYLGWVMAGSLKSFEKANKNYNVRCAVAVGLTPDGADVRKTFTAKYNDSIPLFYLQGGFEMERLHGMNRLLMSVMRKFLVKQARSKPEQSPDDVIMVDMMLNGGSFVKEENLQPVIDFIHS